jgi:hypothetical protein
LGNTGDTGPQGIVGPEGPQGESFTPNALGPTGSEGPNTRNNYDGEPLGFSFLDVNNGNLYFKISNDYADWSAPFQFGRGATGSTGPVGPDGPLPSFQEVEIFNTGSLQNNQDYTITGGYIWDDIVNNFRWLYWIAIPSVDSVRTNTMFIRTTDLVSNRVFEIGKPSSQFFSFGLLATNSPTFNVKFAITSGTVRYIFRVTNYI